MTTISIEDAQAKLPGLIDGLSKGEELIIIQEGRIVARIIGERVVRREPRVAGLAKGMMTIVSERRRSS